jgi:hypothetical protein
MDDPSCRKSKTEREEPIFEIPYIEIDEPMRAKFLTDKAEPR